MNRKPQTKAEAIRIVVAEGGVGMTNKAIELEVRRRFKMNVQHNEIVNCIGSMTSRKVFEVHSEYWIEKAKKFILAVGDAGMANKFLKIAAEELNQ